MSGPVPAPTIPQASPGIPAIHADQLAFYAAKGMSVLAPRGWHCIEVYSSGGSFLLVTPRLYTADTLPNFYSLIGPAVELSLLSGENSGRDQVADVFSRLFPFKREFIHDAAENYDTPRRTLVVRFPRTAQSAADGRRSITSPRHIAMVWAPMIAAWDRAPIRSLARQCWREFKTWTAWWS